MASKHVKLHDDYDTLNFPAGKPATKGEHRKPYAQLLFKKNTFHLPAGHCETRSPLIRIMFLHSSLRSENQREIQGNSLQSYLNSRLIT